MYHRALRLIRTYHNLSQIEVSEKLGLSKSYISEIEKGVKKPSIDVLERYAINFDLPLSHLLLFSESTNKNMVERVHNSTANKILRMLEWLDKTIQNEAT